MPIVLVLPETDLIHQNLPPTCASATEETSTIEASMVTDISTTTEAQGDHPETTSTPISPTSATGTAPTLTTGTAPTLTTGTAPTLATGTAPTLVTGTAPTAPTLTTGTAPQSEESDECITGNEIITDNNNDTCMALDSNMGNGLFMPLATITSSCVHMTGPVFLDIITKGNTSCSVIRNKIYVEAERFGCKDALRLRRCKFVDVQSKSNCRITCQCKEDLPCHLWHENSSRENFDICEISAVHVFS